MTRCFLCCSVEFNMLYKNMNIIQILNPFLIQNLGKIKKTDKNLAYLPSVTGCLTFHSFSRFTVFSVHQSSVELFTDSWVDKMVNLLRVLKVKHLLTGGRYDRLLFVLLILRKFCIRKGFRICIISYSYRTCWTLPNNIKNTW